MDLSALIIVIVLSTLFFGFIVWLSIHSRKNSAKEMDFAASETGGNDE